MYMSDLPPLNPCNYYPAAMIPLRDCGSGAEKLPTRAALVAARGDPDGVGARTRAAIRLREPVAFLPYDVYESQSNFRTVFHMSGALLDGTRATVALENIPIDFYVALTPEALKLSSAVALAEALREEAIASGRDRALRGVTCSVVEGRPRGEFTLTPRKYVRLGFQTTGDRNRAINALQKKKHELCREDKGFSGTYWRKICRENDLSCSDPLWLETYRAEQTGDGTWAFQLNGPDSLRSVRPAFADAAMTKRADDEMSAEPALRRRRGIVIPWDIETYKPVRDGSVPLMTNPTAEITLIGFGVFFEDEDTPLARVVLSRFDYEGPAIGGPDDAEEGGPAEVKVVCPSEKALLCAFVHAIARLRPDVMADFNGSKYDWPQVIEALHTRYRILGLAEAALSSAPLRWNGPQSDADVRKWQASPGFFKVGADQTERPEFLKVPGIIPVDLRLLLWRMFPKAEKKSLNAFLKITKLPSKSDLSCPDGIDPYEYQFRIVEAAKAVEAAAVDAAAGFVPTAAVPHGPAARAAARVRAPRRTPVEKALPDDATLAREIRAYARYCVIDAERCQALLRRKKILGERREVAVLSFTSLYESLYKADGVRVLNLMGHFESALRSRLRFELERQAREAPDDAPQIAEKIKCLALQIFGTFSSRKVSVALRREAEEMRSRGVPEEVIEERLQKVKYPGAWVFDVLCKEIERDRPVTGLDFSSLYPSLIMAYCLSPDRSLVGDRAGKTPEEIEAMETSGRLKAEALTSLGYTIHPVEFPFCENSILDWFVRGRPGQSLEQREDRGMYPAILMDLFGRRKTLKKTKLEPLKVLDEELSLIVARAKKAATGPATAATAYPNVLRARIEELASAGEAAGDSSDEEAAAADTAPPKVIGRLEEILEAGLAACEGATAIAPPSAAADVLAGLVAEAWKVYIEEVMEETDRLLTDVDLKQKALKVFMNTFYGVCGNKRSPLYFLTVAGGTTSAGRVNIQAVARLVTERGNTVHYGDSVSSDTAIITRFGGTIVITSIDHIGDGDWIRTTDAGGITKELNVPYFDVEVWSDEGWTKVESVVRHLTDKKMYKVTMGDGSSVTVTEDHGLLLPDGTEVSPRDIKPGDRLMTSDLSTIASELDRAVEPLTYEEDVYDWYPTVVGTGHAWNISDNELRAPKEELERILQCVDAESPPKYAPPCELSLRVLEHRLGRRLVSEHKEADGGIVESVEVVPARVTDCPEDSYVYDLTTANHHFHAGTGGLIVHNTDSVYLSCNKKIMDAYLDSYSAYSEWKVANPEAPDSDAPAAALYAGRVTRAVAAKDMGIDAAALAHPVAECVASNNTALLRSWGWRPMTRERLWTKKVWATMRQLRIEQGAANAMLRSMNGTGFLRLAYEEVLFPVMFTGKKKYFGIAHEGVPNFHPRRLFIRGIDTIKQGQTGLAKTIADRIMWQAVAVGEERPMLEIVEEYLADAICKPTQWNFDDFVQVATYKPDKQNIPVQTFVRRMLRRHTREKADNARRLAAGETPVPFRYEPPQAADKFRFVLVHLDGVFLRNGRRAVPKKGDMMEYASVIREDGGVAALNLPDYLTRAALGFCGRFVSGAFTEAAETGALAVREKQRLAGSSLKGSYTLGSFEAEAEISKGADEAAFRAAKRHLAALLEKAHASAAGIAPERLPRNRLGAAYRKAYDVARGGFVAAAGAALGTSAFANAAIALADRPEDEADDPGADILIRAAHADAEARAASLANPTRDAKVARRLAAIPRISYYFNSTVQLGRLRKADRLGELHMAKSGAGARAERAARVRRATRALLDVATECNLADALDAALEAHVGRIRDLQVEVSLAKDARAAVKGQSRPVIAAANAEIKAAERAVAAAAVPSAALRIALDGDTEGSTSRFQRLQDAYLALVAARCTELRAQARARSVLDVHARDAGSATQAAVGAQRARAGTGAAIEAYASRMGGAGLPLVGILG